MILSGILVSIGVSFLVGGTRNIENQQSGAGFDGVPLMNEIIVETTYPAGEGTSTGIDAWLTAALSSAIIAISSLILYGDLNDYPDSVCRIGELQDLFWLFTIQPNLIQKMDPKLITFLTFERVFKTD